MQRPARYSGRLLSKLGQGLSDFCALFFLEPLAQARALPQSAPHGRTDRDRALFRRLRGPLVYLLVYTPYAPRKREPQGPLHGFAIPGYRGLVRGLERSRREKLREPPGSLRRLPCALGTTFRQKIFFSRVRVRPFFRVAP